MSISTLTTHRYQEPLAAQTNALFAVSTIRLAESCTANQSHRSEHYEIFFIESGSGTYEIDFNSFEIETAGLFCLSPGQALTVNSETLKSGYKITFNREFYCVETHGKEIACNGVLFNNVHRATAVPLAVSLLPTFQLIVQNMIRELQSPGKAHREALETFLRMFLIEALRQYEPPKNETDNKEINGLTGDFIALVEKHFRELRSITDYAQKLFVSPKSLAKRLNADGYPTPTEIIRNRVVLEAKRELRYSQKSIKEIAFELGFEDPAYFTRYFKKAEGDSPANYRATYI